MQQLVDPITAGNISSRSSMFGWRQKNKRYYMITYHWVFCSFYCSLLVSLYLFLLYHFSMRNLQVGSLNINGGRGIQNIALISEVFTQKNKKVTLILQETNPTDEAD